MVSRQLFFSGSKQSVDGFIQRREVAIDDLEHTVHFDPKVLVGY
jgi:hypothetical protein